MVHISREINRKQMTEIFAPKFQHLSLRGVKGISVGFLLCTILGFLLFWQPAYFKLQALEHEKTYWLDVLKTNHDVNKKSDNKASSIPTMDQLPGLIEQCRCVFANNGVDVISLNVERFGERRETGKGASLDHSLVRLHFYGNWKDIVTSLKALEETPVGNIHLQEVVLDAEGGEALLQIYFCTGG